MAGTLQQPDTEHRKGATIMIASHARAALLLAMAALLLAGPAFSQDADEEGFIPLFDGKTLDGWEATGAADWTVEEGVLIGKQGEGNTPGDLWTTETFGDFELQVTFKVVWPANSGLWFRSNPPDALGYQVDILDLKEYGCTVGTIYCDGFLSQNLDESIVNLDDWNTITLKAVGYELNVDLNGHEVANVVDEQERFAEGKIGWQVHAGDQYADMRIMVKECKIKPLGEE